MGTNSFIGQMQEDKSIRGIYCHFDGYVEHAGYTLLRHYNVNRAKVSELLDLGNLSFLGPGPRDGTCAYARDRKEDLQEASCYQDLTDVLELNRSFSYVQLIDGNWIYSFAGAGKWFPIPTPPPIIEPVHETIA